MNILVAYGLTVGQQIVMVIGLLSLLTMGIVIVKFFFKKFLPALWESFKLIFRK